MSKVIVDADTGEVLEGEPQAIMVPEPGHAVAHPVATWNREQIDLIKRTVAKDTTDVELQLFLYTAGRIGLDPLLRQIHAVKRGGTMAIQVAIDGYRLVADRTAQYAPGGKPTFEYAENGNLIAATAYVKKLVAGTWHEVAATAHFDEYAQIFNGRPGNMWATKPHIMLAKCAEALALRRAFPAETAGTYSDDEMQQADKDVAPPAQQSQAPSALRRAAPTPAKAVEYAEDEQGRMHVPPGRGGSKEEAPSPEQAPPVATPQPTAAAMAKAKKQYAELATRVIKMASVCRTKGESEDLKSDPELAKRYKALGDKLAADGTKALDAGSSPKPMTTEQYQRGVKWLEGVIKEADHEFKLAEDDSLPF